MTIACVVVGTGTGIEELGLCGELAEELEIGTELVVTGLLGVIDEVDTGTELMVNGLSGVVDELDTGTELVVTGLSGVVEVAGVEA